MAPTVQAELKQMHPRRLLFPLLLLLISLPTHADILTGTVVSVADGDTITVLDANREQHKIRVAGIDCPEKAQPFGQRATQSMSTIVACRPVVRPPPSAAVGLAEGR